MHLRSYGFTMAAACACPLSPRDRVPFLILTFRRVLASAPMRPLCVLDPHFCRAHTGASIWVQAPSRLLPDSQSGITSRKCGLRGRPREFRVSFGPGPKEWANYPLCNTEVSYVILLMFRVNRSKKEKQFAPQPCVCDYDNTRKYDLKKSVCNLWTTSKMVKTRRESRSMQRDVTLVLCRQDRTRTWK